jgi:predicted amidophosphoribosyltransferase
MLFKRNVAVDEYCRQNLATLFSTDREATWEALRSACDDEPLNQASAQLYYRHLRAVFIHLMLIAVAKNCSMDASSDAHIFVMLHLKERGQSEVDEISRHYNQAFASSSTDGVAEMAQRFGDWVAAGRVKQETIQRLQAEFYTVLRLFFDDFKSIKLIASR